MGLLNKYFNRETLTGQNPVATRAMLTGAAAAFLFAASGGAPVNLISGVVVAAFAIGDVNVWQKKATGNYFWTPRICGGL